MFLTQSELEISEVRDKKTRMKGEGLATATADTATAAVRETHCVT